MIDGLKGMQTLGSLLGLGKQEGDSGGMFATLLKGFEGGEKDAAAAVASDGMSPATKDALDMLREMTQGGFKGYFAWMVKKMREEVMDKMGISDADLANMNPEQRAAVEKLIAEEVAKKVAKALGIDPEKAQKMMADVQNVQPVDPTDPAAVAKAKQAYKGVTAIL